MRKCPYCAEEVQDEARKCKHCGEWLQEGQAEAIRTAQHPSPPRANKHPPQSFNLAKLIGFAVLGLLGGSMLGALVTPIARGFILASANPRDRALHEICEADPSCNFPVLDGAGYVALFGVVVVVLLATRSRWREGRSSSPAKGEPK